MIHLGAAERAEMSLICCAEHQRAVLTKPTSNAIEMQGQKTDKYNATSGAENFDFHSGTGTHPIGIQILCFTTHHIESKCIPRGLQTETSEFHKHQLRLCFTNRWLDFSTLFNYSAL